MQGARLKHIAGFFLVADIYLFVLESLVQCIKASSPSACLTTQLISVRQLLKKKER